jgi:hypothetical protein
MTGSALISLGRQQEMLLATRGLWVPCSWLHIGPVTISREV